MENDQPPITIAVENLELEMFLAGLNLPPPKPRRIPGDRVRAAAEDYLLRLADRRRSRIALADDQIDALRFRFWFSTQMGSHISIHDWRKRIDQMILEHSHAPT